MKRRNYQQKQSHKSHDVLHAISINQDCPNSIPDLKRFKIQPRPPSLQKRMRKNSQVTPLKQIKTLNKHFIKCSPLLQKKQNKIQANIQLHNIDKPDDNYCIAYSYSKPSPQINLPPRIDSYFRPNTKKSILSKHSSFYTLGSVGNFRKKHQSKYSIKVATECFSNNSNDQSPEKLSPFGSNPALFEKRQQYIQVNKYLSPSSILSSSDCISTSKSPSRLLIKQMQELAFLDLKIPHNKQISVSNFTCHELVAYYKSLIHFCQGSLPRYISGFQAMLNLMNIATNENTIKQLISNFINKPSFDQFMKAFERIVECSLKESVVDYFQIVLDRKRNCDLSYVELIELFSERMSNYYAREIVQELYYYLDKASDTMTNLQEIVGLCYHKQEFCSYMRGYCKQTHRKMNQKNKLAS